MKRNWIVPTALGVLLLVSVIGNAWQFATLRMERMDRIDRDKADHEWFSYPHGRPPEYPMPGVTPADLKAMVDAIVDHTDAPEYRNILVIRVVGKDCVEIKTGHVLGPLAGSGRIYLFNRTEDGWKLDKSMHWIS